MKSVVGFITGFAVVCAFFIPAAYADFDDAFDDYKNKVRDNVRYDIESLSSSTPLDHGSSHWSVFCSIMYMDVNLNSVFAEVCTGNSPSIKGNAGIMYSDRVSYRHGDVMDISASHALFNDPAIRFGYLVNNYDNDRILPARTLDLSQNYTDFRISVLLDDNRFDSGCYTVFGAFYDIDNNPSLMADDFCILSDYNLEPREETTSLSGVVTSNGIGVADLRIIAVDLSDFTKEIYATTDQTGKYSFGQIDAGDYLVQVVGTDAYTYLTITDGQSITHNFSL